MSNSMAIAYSMNKKRKKYADGGDVAQPTASPSPQPETNTDKAQKSIASAFGGFANGGEVKAHDVSDEIVDRIMRKAFSKGGEVANATPPMADSMPSEFDDLALDDSLHGTNSGAADGDDLGDAEEDHERGDVISRILKSRAKKDRMPRPA